MSEKDRDSLTLAVAGKIFSCAVFNELAQAIMVLLEDQGLRESMGLKSRAKAEKEYSIQQVVERTFAIYEGA